MGVVNFLANIMPAVDVPGLDRVVGAFLKVLDGGIGNICLTMIVFALILKLILTPLDFIARKTAKNNQVIQERLKPQLDKIDKMCGDDKRLAQQKKSMLLRKSGQKMLGACLAPLITMGLTIYVFTALNSYVTFNTANIYNEMAAHYEKVILVENADGEFERNPDGSFVFNEVNYSINDDPSTADINEAHTLTEEGKKAMVEKYQSIVPKFLWIKNPYRPDAWQGAIPTYSEFKSGTIGARGLVLEGEFAEIQYQQVMGSIAESSRYKGWNGYMILPILAAAVSFLSQFFLSKLQPQPQGAGGQSEKTMKMMRIIGPLMTLYFSFMYTSALAIYFLFSNLFNFGFSLLIGLIVNKMVKKKEIAFQGTQSYRRR